MIRFGNEKVERPGEIPICRQTLADFLQIPTVSFRENLGGNGVVFELSGPANKPAEATGRSYTVLPLLDLDGTYFWVAVVLDYVFERGLLELRATSIVLFHGLAESTKDPLLRAEWENFPPPRPHAQPHWHVYPASYVGHDGPDAGAAILHLAMAARWHDADGGDEPHYTELSGEGVVRWMRGCLTYLGSEVAFLAKKRPA